PASLLRLLTSKVQAHPRTAAFPYTTLFRPPAAVPARVQSQAPESGPRQEAMRTCRGPPTSNCCRQSTPAHGAVVLHCGFRFRRRSEEHTSELQSRDNLVCRLLLEKQKNKES